jgi:hypothetical protein
MSDRAATFQSVFDKTATAYDFVCAVADRNYWLDNTYVQPFYAWAAPRLRDVAISSLFWGLIALIDVALWLADTTRQFMARDAQAHEPLPELPALAPAAIPLALPALGASLLPIAPALGLGLDLGVSDTTVPALALCLAMPMSPRSSIYPDDSVRRWVAAALPLVLPSIVEAAMVSDVGSVVPVVPSVTEAAPVVKKSCQSTNKTTDIKTATAKAPRKRSQRTAAAR